MTPRTTPKRKRTSKAVAHLERADPILGAAIRRIALQPVKSRNNLFQSLVEEIISQQLSGRVADVITERFLGLFDAISFPQPEDVLGRADDELRKSGLSYQKISYIKNISIAVKSGELDFKKLAACSDEDAIATLTKIKGVGRWTAEMFLMFTLGREDIFSYGDLGLKNAIQRLYGLRTHPSKKTAERISKKWSPHRTLACRYLWASLKSE